MLNINPETITLMPYEQYCIDWDVASISLPVRYPTVWLSLEDTEILRQAADRILEEEEMKPLESGYPAGEYGSLRRYVFTIRLNGLTDTKVDPYIEFCTERSADVDGPWRILLTEGEQKAVFDILNRQCERLYGKSGDELLEDARVALERKGGIGNV